MMLRRISGLLPLFASRPASPPVTTRLTGTRVMLRLGLAEDWWAWRNLRSINRGFLTPWEPKWPDRALDHRIYTAQARRNWRDWRRGSAYAFLIFLAGDKGQPETLIGGISLTDIVRGSDNKATLGYWMGEAHTGRGLMTEAVALVCDFAFATLRLNRIEATCMPHNESSKAVLVKNGFTEEGFALKYLQINGRMEDHLLWGKTAPIQTVTSA